MIVRSKFNTLPELPAVRWAAGVQPTFSERERQSAPIVQRPLRLGEIIMFGQHGNADRFLFGNDCHFAESDFRWVKHLACRLAFNALFDSPAALVVHLQVMVERPWSDLQLEITLNGERLQIQRCSQFPDIIKAAVCSPLRPSIQPNYLIFYSKLTVVSEIIGGSDDRRIGVGLSKLRFIDGAR